MHLSDSKTFFPTASQFLLNVTSLQALDWRMISSKEFRWDISFVEQQSSQKWLKHPSNQILNFHSQAPALCSTPNWKQAQHYYDQLYQKSQNQTDIWQLQQ